VNCTVPSTFAVIDGLPELLKCIDFERIIDLLITFVVEYLFVVPNRELGLNSDDAANGALFESEPLFANIEDLEKTT
jgi:hypothetical protein